MAKTVVVGKDSKLVEQVLNILSYFIRCSEVFEHVQKKDDESKDNVHDNISNLGEESICSQCGKTPAEVEHSDKSCNLTSEIEGCLKCKQKCDGNCLVQELQDTQGKECLHLRILKQFHVNGMHCSKCGAENKSLEELSGIEMLKTKCLCNSISNGGVGKELKHIIKDANHSKSFRCYCCENQTGVNGILSQDTKEKCFCDSGCDTGNYQGNQDSIKQLHSKEHHCINCLHKLLAQKCNDGCQNQANNCLTKLGYVVQSKDVLGNFNGHTDICVSETDSCLSDETDTASVRSSLPERSVDGTVAAYGRSGSADSGIYQSPLNSPSAQRSVDFCNVLVHQGEEKQIPKELSLPTVVDVNCCPDPNR